MEIAELFNYQSIHELRRYRQTRFPWTMSVPLALFLCLASLATESVPIIGALLRIPIALVLLFQFRLWNDLHNVPRDRREGLDRVLPKATSPGVFYGALWSAFAANFILLALLKPVSHLIGFVAMSVLTLAANRVGSGLRLPSGVRYHLLLLKYPIIVYLLSSREYTSLQVGDLLAMAVVYWCFCLYEGLHDERLWGERAAIGLVAFDAIVLSGLAAGMVWQLGRRSLAAGVVQAVLMALGLLVLGFLLQYRRRLVPPGRWCYAVFVPCFLWLLNSILATPLQVVTSRIPGVAS